MSMHRPQADPTPADVKRFLAEHPGDPDGLTSLGALLSQAGEREAASLFHRRAVVVAPGHAVARSNRTVALSAKGQHARAIASGRVAVALAPDTALVYLTLTGALYKAGDFAADRIVLERLIRLDSGDPSLTWGRAQVRLHAGDYPGGFADYEGRYWLREYHYRLHRGPRWDGGPLDGRFVMVTLEQGFGDTLLMARYLPLLKAQGARRVIVELRDELRRLFTPMEGVDAFIEKDAAPTPIYHVHSSIMSLPRHFGTSIASVPPPVRLTVPEEARAKAARLLGPEDGRLKVGIVWSGSPAFADNAIRATSLDRFLRFARIPGVRLYSLQKGPQEDELRALPSDTPITALGPELADFADTAAVVERLDLVVMTDSSVAHLAGSLGVPVWVLLQHVPYWVYGMSGATTPWYPSMRLYRQGPKEEWEPVFDAVERDLRVLAVCRAAAPLERCSNP
jgi:tetratricopeptide (TPR) repeat protein